MTRPWRRMTLQWSQMGLTEGLTFMTSSLRCLHRAGRSLGCYFSTGLAVAVDDAPAGEVVGRQLHDDTVLGDDADVVLPHLAGDRREDFVTVAQLNAEHRVGQGLGDHTLDLDDTVFLRHTLANTCADRSICGGWVSVRRHANTGATHQRSSIRDSRGLGNLAPRGEWMPPPGAAASTRSSATAAGDRHCD